MTHLASIADEAEHDALARSILRVGAADKVHNLRSIVADFHALGEATWDRFNGGREGTLWYYRTVLAIYRRGPPSRSIDLLARTLDELEQMLPS